MDETFLTWALSGGVYPEDANRRLAQWRKGIINTRELAVYTAMDAPDQSKAPLCVFHSSGAVTLLKNRSSVSLLVLPASPE